MIDNEFAYIQVVRNDVPYGRGYDTYKWIGPINKPVVVRDEEVISFLPWPMKRIETAEFYMGGLYIRKDVRWWWITYAFRKVSNGWRWFYYRVLATLRIWDLARYQEFTQPSWRDIRPIAWIIKKKRPR